jgi:hypothetical protein
VDRQVGPGYAGSTLKDQGSPGLLNRSDFGMTFNVALEGGGVMVGDRIEITIEVEAVLRGPADTT